MDSKPHAAPVVVLYERMTPAAQQRLIDRFVVRHPDRLVQLTALKARLADKKHRC